MKSRHHQACRALVAAAILGMAGTTAAHAQFRASLTGTVTDPTGAVIPGAQVTLTDTQTGKVLTATSNESGIYSFNALPADSFNLTTKIAGFKTSTIKGLSIIPEQANNTNVQLQLGTADTTVDVNADTLPTLQTATAAITGVISSRDIQHIPSAGRDVFQLAQLAPGTFGDGAQGASGGTSNLPGTQGPGGSGATAGIFQTENGPQTLSAGGQYETNSISIDGISTTSAVWGGTSIITPNEDSVENVQITSNGYDAEYGRFSGANIQVTSKSGTNSFHGSVFFRMNRAGLNAYQRYNGPSSLQANGTPTHGLLRDTTKLNDEGGSIGGPIIKDKLFAFFAYETIRGSFQQTQLGWYETPQFDAAAPAANIANRYTTFAGHTPENAVLQNASCNNAGLTEGTYCHAVAGGLDIGSPLKTARGTQDPTYLSATQPGYGGGLDGVPDFAFYETSTPNQNTQTQYNGRADWNATQKDHVSFAIYWVPQTQHYINGPARAYNQWNHNQINDAFSVIYNHTFSATFLNEARANAAGWRWNELTDNPQAPFGLAIDSINTIGSIGLQPFGASGPSNLNQWTYGYKDVATKIVRNHTIKFGADATQLHYLQNPLYAARPGFNFYNVWNFLNDAPYAESGQFNRFTGMPFANRFDMREVIYGGFAQDNWKVTPNLTVNYGLRYNYFNSLYSKQNNLPHINFGSGAALLTGIQDIRGGYVWTPDKANLGPQLGFAYNPEFLSKRLVIRGGFGLNYNQEEIAISANSSNNPNDAVTPTFNQSTPTAADPHIVYQLPSDSSSIFGYPANPNTISNFNANGLPSGGNLSLTTYPNHLRTQQVYHYSLDTQFDLGHQLVASASYQGSTAKHLIFHQNLNIYEAYHGVAFNPLTPFVEYFGDTGGSNYNALLLDLKRNFSHQFSFDASFTYAKSMDDNSGPYEEDPYPWMPSYNRGRSDFNFGKAFKLYGVYEPKVYYGGNQLARTMLNGFSFSGIFNIHTGFPFTPISSYNQDYYYLGSGYGTLRPSAYNGRAGHDTSNSNFIKATGPSNDFKALTAANAGTPAFDYFAPAPAPNSTKFPTLPTQYPVPGIARNSFNGPGYHDVDATITKTFGLPRIPGLGERAGLEIRGDAFNLFNETNPTSVSNNIQSANFGVAQAGLGGRTVQVQARFSF